MKRILRYLSQPRFAWTELAVLIIFLAVLSGTSLPWYVTIPVALAVWVLNGILASVLRQPRRRPAKTASDWPGLFHLYGECYDDPTVCPQHKDDPRNKGGA